MVAYPPLHSGTAANPAILTHGCSRLCAPTPPTRWLHHFPGRNFPGRNFPASNFPRDDFPGRDFPASDFPDVIRNPDFKVAVFYIQFG
jgi:hypothetical protein